MSKKLIGLALLALTAFGGQDNPPAATSASSSEWGTKTIQVKYIDPDQLRDVFSGRSFAIQVNRELKTLTVSGPASFLNEIEETSKRLDVEPEPPANIEITVYLLGISAQANPTHNFPTELTTVTQKLQSSLGVLPLKLTDSQTLRIREGQPTDMSFGEAVSSGVGLTRFSLRSASVSTKGKANLISLNGLHCWFTKAPGQSTPASDVVGNIDVPANDAVLVAEAGIDKPVAVVVRVSLVR